MISNVRSANTGFWHPLAGEYWLSGMEPSPFAIRLCNVAREVLREWPEPRIRLLREAGIYDLENKLDYEDVKAAIARDPSLAHDWQMWSDGKRYGGYAMDAENADRVSACAKFVIQEAGIFRQLWLERQTAR